MGGLTAVSTGEGGFSGEVRAGSIQPCAQLERCFLDLIRNASRSMRTRLDPWQEGYLADLMVRGMDPAVFVHPTDATGAPTTLAETLIAARHSCGQQRLDLLRSTGDRALFIAGLFVESLSRKIVGAGYYRRMGATAYRQLSVECGCTRQGDFYVGLSERFSTLANLLGEISTVVFPSQAASVADLARKWLECQSPTTLLQVQDKGLVLVAPSASIC